MLQSIRLQTVRHDLVTEQQEKTDIFSRIREFFFPSTMFSVLINLPEAFFKKQKQKINKVPPVILMDCHG